MQKKIILWQSYFCQIGGVETFVYNWALQLRDYFDILILYKDGDYNQIKRIKPYVRCEKIDESKIYEADIAIRNSVWVAPMPENIKATRIIEMQHANYKFLRDTGKLEKQYVKDERVTEHLGCGEFVAKMYEEVTGQKIPFIPNILAPKKKTEKIYRFLSTSRVYDSDKGWNEILKFCEMMKQANIKFEFIIFSWLPPDVQRIPYPEIHVYDPRLDILDYVTDTDYVVLFTKSEGRPYSIAEALQYGKPCIVTDVGGCTELIKDGENGYVVPLDMNFDINRIKKIPKVKPYKDESLDLWCDYLGGAECIKKPLIEYEDVEIEAIDYYYDTQLRRDIKPGDKYKVDEDRAHDIVSAHYAKYVR